MARSSNPNPDLFPFPVPTSLELAGQLREKFGDLISEPLEFRGEVTVTIADPERIAEVCGHAKSALGFDLLLDLSSVDNYGDPEQFGSPRGARPPAVQLGRTHRSHPSDSLVERAGHDLEIGRAHV